MCSPPSPTRSRTRGHRTATAPMPVMISRSGRCPWRTSRRRPSSVNLSVWVLSQAATSASTACPNSVLAPLRKTSVSGSENVPGWVSSKTLVSVTAYHSFGGEVEALNTPTIRRLTPSCRHQLSALALVPRGTSLRWIVVLSLRQFGVRRSDCRRHFPCPAELGSITPHAMHNHGAPSCQCDDGFFLPPTLGNVHRPCLQPRPFLHAGQHDLRGLIEQRSHGLVATSRD